MPRGHNLSLSVCDLLTTVKKKSRWSDLLLFWESNFCLGRRNLKKAFMLMCVLLLPWGSWTLLQSSCVPAFQQNCWKGQRKLTIFKKDPSVLLLECVLFSFSLLSRWKKLSNMQRMHFWYNFWRISHFSRILFKDLQVYHKEQVSWIYLLKRNETKKRKLRAVMRF